MLHSGARYIWTPPTLMCLILFGYRSLPGVPLVVAANRDEHHTRASSPVAVWHDEPSIIAGRDLVAGGTWLGTTTTGRFAALTNFADPTDPDAPRSRGLLVQEFLAGEVSAHEYAADLEGHHYAGFNLLMFDGETLVCTSNKGGTHTLEPGFYGLSNAAWGTPWPKCVDGAQALDLACRNETTEEALLSILNDRQAPADERLPQRGRDLAFERRVAPKFIVGEDYGTRASTIVHIGHNSLRITEQTYLAGGVTGDRVAHEHTF